MNSLDKKFKHSIWFKGKDMTVREFLEYAAHAYGAFGIVKRPSLKQSENLLDEVKYDFVLVGDERGSYRLTVEQYNYYAEHYNKRVSELFANDKETLEKLLLPLSVLT